MSLSDCEICWGTPCSCGWEWKTYTTDCLRRNIEMFNLVIRFKEENPNAIFSPTWKIGVPRTEDDKKFLDYMNKCFFKKEKNGRT